MCSSIIVAGEFENGVIIGSDSRRTIGEFNISYHTDIICNKTANKLMKVDDRIYCSGFGSEANIQFIFDQVIYQLHTLKLNAGGGGTSVIAAASIFRDLCYYNRNTINADFLIVGWDNTNKSQVYLISSGGMMKREAICAIGSGSLYVHGYVDQFYTAHMNKEEAERFVLNTIKIAMTRDNKSGGYINLSVITDSEVEVHTVFKQDLK